MSHGTIKRASVPQKEIDVWIWSEILALHFLEPLGKLTGSTHGVATAGSLSWNWYLLPFELSHGAFPCVGILLSVCPGPDSTDCSLFSGPFYETNHPGTGWRLEQLAGSILNVRHQGYIVSHVLRAPPVVKLLAASQTVFSIGHMTESHMALAGLILPV